MSEDKRKKSIIERFQSDKDILSLAKRVKTAFFSGLAFFLVFVILVCFGLPVAYIAHLVVNIGSQPPERFTMPSWVKSAESWSIGIFVLALLVLAAVEPWKDAYRYFRYGSVELDKTVESNEGVKLAEPTPAPRTGQSPQDLVASSKMNNMSSKSIQETGAMPESVNAVTEDQTPKSRSNRKNRRGRRH